MKLKLCRDATHVDLLAIAIDSRHLVAKSVDRIYCQTAVHMQFPAVEKPDIASAGSSAST